MVGLPPSYYVRYCCTSKAWNAGSNACVQIPSCLAVSRALFEFFFVITKNILHLFNKFIFELRALIGMECLGWFEDGKYSFDKSYRYKDVWCTRDFRRVGFRQNYLNSLNLALIRAGHVRQDCRVRSYK